MRACHGLLFTDHQLVIKVQAGCSLPNIATSHSQSLALSQRKQCLAASDSSNSVLACYSVTTVQQPARLTASKAGAQSMPWPFLPGLSTHYKVWLSDHRKEKLSPCCAWGVLGMSICPLTICFFYSRKAKARGLLRPEDRKSLHNWILLLANFNSCVIWMNFF